MTANEPLNQHDNCQPKIPDARDSADTAQDQTPAPEDKGPADVPSPGRPMGPRTAEGKERSRFNRVGHGAYLKASPYIVSGFLAEVREEVETFLDELVGDLAPRNALERAAARDVALAFLSSVRLEKSEALALGNVLTPDVTHPVLTPDPLLARNPVHDHHFLVIDQLVGTDTFLTDIDFDDLVAPYSPYISWYSANSVPRRKAGHRQPPRDQGRLSPTPRWRHRSQEGSSSRRARSPLPSRWTSYRRRRCCTHRPRGPSRRPLARRSKSQGPM
jgi:hypothetical protein